MAESSPEFWLRGPIPNVPDLLQPVAHALLQVRKEVSDAVADVPEELLWEKPSGVASVGFHLQHLAGVLDRLFTYARGEQLNKDQLQYLEAEGKPDGPVAIELLLKRLDRQIDKSIAQLKMTAPETLLETRGVGRKQIPSTLMGLLFHAAEHSMRHTGQLLVTVKILVINTSS